MDPPRPSLQNPIPGTTIDTSPSTLHLQLEQQQGGSSTVVDKIVRKASQVKESGHRKLNSLSRRAKSPRSDEGQSPSYTRPESSGTEARVLVCFRDADDAETPKMDNINRGELPAETVFVQPESKASSRPSLSSLSFRGEGSVRDNSTRPCTQITFTDRLL